MKQLLFFTVFLSGLGVQGQTITIFEAGGGAAQSMYAGFGNGITMSADESESFFENSGPSNDSIKVLFYNAVPSGADLWITGRIPQMDIYAQLELFADMTLPQTAGFSYSVSTDSINWNTVPLSNPNVPVAFDNSAGNKFLRLSVRLNESDSARFSYNYVSVKANSNFFVNLEETTEFPGSVTAFRQTVTVNMDQPDAYKLGVYDLNGRSVFTADGNGSQTFETSGLEGIYLVAIHCAGQQLIRRCYFAE
jgi:hypothetical protein